MRKIFVLDTNVLLDDPNAIFSFADNIVVIPIVCIEEIDRFKKDHNDIGRNARAVSRNLDGLRAKGTLSQGVALDDQGGQLRISLGEGAIELLPVVLRTDGPTNDNRILSVALQERKQVDSGMPVILLSRDVNLRIKADAVGISAKDYRPDRIVAIEELYSGVVTHEVNRETIDRFYAEKTLEQGAEWELYPQQFVLMQDPLDPQHTGVGRFDPDKQAVVPLQRNQQNVWGLTPRNLEQQMALDLLLNDSVQLVTLVGKAGTGKTLMALAAGLMRSVDDQVFKKLLVSRPVFPMGRDIGFLPGEIGDKLKPWMQPIFDNLEFLLETPKKEGKNSGSGYQELIRQQLIEVEPLTYIRGRSIPHQYFIVDEAQNLTPHEIKTILSRAGVGTKIVLTGDPYQIDNPYLDSSSNGLSYVVERLKGSPLVGHIMLKKGERSPLAQTAADQL